jgi:DNA (cytosine-5)-methyltransferase 1
VKYVSIFSGIEAATVAWQPLGWEPLAFSEIDPFPSTVLQHHYPDIPNLGDITKIDWNPYKGQADLVVGGSPCFPAGTLILTSEHLKPIEEIKVGDMVLTHRNRWRRVTATGSKIADTIVLRGNGVSSLECTPNHPFYARTRVHRESGYGYEYKQEWIPATDMVGRQWLNMNAATEPLPVPALPDGVSLTEPFLRLIGTWLSLGQSSSLPAFRFDSQSINRWVMKQFGGKEKHIPSWVYGLSENLRISLLEGYFQRMDSVRYAQPCSGMQLLVGMKILAAGAGYRSSILYEENPSIHSTGTYRIKFNTSPIDSDDFDDDGYWGRVNEKTVGRSNVLVYNLEVEDDHSYVAAGIAVHNCQSFSVAGKREGLAGASGLMFEYIRAVRELRPRWFVWENVPGAFTSERGEAYRQLLSEMDALGYGLAWRVLDAQFFGVAQRRERVFLVGSLGTMRCAEVLFERESLSWDHQSSRQKRQALAEEAQGCVGEADHDSGRLTPGETQSRRVYPTSGVYPTLSTREKSGQNQESVFTQFGDDIAGTLTARYDSSPCVDRGANVVVDDRDKVFLCQTAQTGSNGKLVKQDDVMNTLDRTNSTAVAALDFKVKPVAFLYNQGAKARSLGISEISPTLKTDHNPVVAFASNQRDEVRELEVSGALAAQPGIKQQTYICRADGQANAMTSVDMAPTLTSHAKKDPPLIYPAEDSIGEDALIQRDMSATLSTHNTQTLITGGREKRSLTVRRLTPRECERLQGFPDDYTDIPYRNKEHAPDGPRYKALGNSMAVPVMRWIGERIRTVEEAAETTG